MQNTANAAVKRTTNIPRILIVALVYALSCFGVVSIAIATFNPDNGANPALLTAIINSNSARWQAIFVLVSIAGVAVETVFPISFYKKAAKYVYYIILFVLMITLAAATAVQGINAWLKMGAGRTLQPCEFAKLSVLLMLAQLLSAKEKPMNDIRETIKVFMYIGIPAGVTLLQGETGSVIVMAFMFIVMIFFAGVDRRLFIGIVFAGILFVALLFGYALISQSTDYRITRLLSFLDPNKYSSSGGYQILQSQMAIGSGGKNGIGAFVIGSVSQLDYVPEDHTDFIFSAIGEAFGFRGCLFILVAYLLIICLMLYESYRTTDKFCRLIIVGVMAMLLVHIFENIAMTIGLMPITGIPLPFLSYGGSNYITNMAGIGLFLCATKNRSIANDLLVVNTERINTANNT